MPSTPPDALTPSVSRQNTSAIVEDCKKRERGGRPRWRLDSNCTSISDPRGTVNFEYDVLHRLTRKRHETTVVAEYTYDGTAANNAIGRLITDTDRAAVSGADKSDYTYDTIGRILTPNPTISATPYTIPSQYESTGALVQLAYPSG